MSKVYYHLTNKSKFKFDPKYQPTNNTTMGGKFNPGIFVAPDPETWIDGYNYRQPFVVQISAPDDILERPGVLHGRYGGEVYIPADQYPNLHIDRIVPTDVIARENYGSHGWIEGDTGVEFDTRKPLPERPTYHEFEGWHYTGPDVREMTPDQVKQLKADARKSLRAHTGGLSALALHHLAEDGDVAGDSTGLPASVQNAGGFARGRRCERCGQSMPPRMSRQRDHRGRLVCETCARTRNHAEWHVTYAKQALPEDLAEEFERREAETLATLSRMARLRTTAHDSGDGETIFHCPFCGSGAVVGGQSGTVTCDFCHSRFTVQVQPEFKAMPQTVDGQPFNIPGMPGGGPDAGAATDQEADDQGAAQAGQDEAPANLDQATPQGDAAQGGSAQPPVLSRLLVQGVALPLETAMQALALRYTDDRAAVLAQVREENGAR